MYLSVSFYMLMLPCLANANSELNLMLFVEKKNTTYNYLCVAKFGCESKREPIITWMPHNISQTDGSIEYCSKDFRFRKELSFGNTTLRWKSSYYYHVPRLSHRWNEFPVFNGTVEIKKRIKILHFSTRKSSVLTLRLENQTLCANLKNITGATIIEGDCESKNNPAIQEDEDVDVWKHYSIFKQSNHFYITNLQEIYNVMGSFRLNSISLDGQFKYDNYTVLNITDSDFKLLSKENGLAAGSCLSVNALIPKGSKLFINETQVEGNEVWKETQICDVFLVEIKNYVLISAISSFRRHDVRYLKLTTPNTLIGCRTINGTEFVSYNKTTKYIENHIDAESALELYQNIAKSDGNSVVICQREGCYCLSGQQDGICRCGDDTWGRGCDNFCTSCEFCDDLTGVCWTKAESLVYLLIILVLICSTIILILYRYFAYKRFYSISGNNEDTEPLNAESTDVNPLDEEFKNIPIIYNQYSQNFGKKDCNKIKNRYVAIIPYDHNRVIISSEAEGYINASYIPGHKGEKTYIATQCPKHITVASFWRMIWQENVAIVICLASFREEQMIKYWNEDSEQEYKNITVKLKTTETLTDFVIRSFSLNDRNRESRTVLHLQYLTWPDHGIPIFPLSLLMFLRYVQSQDRTEAPLLVHCIAGVGRTGTYILCDKLSRYNGNICNSLSNIRKYRTHLVSNKEQYRLVHFITNEYREESVTWKNTTMDLVDLQKQNTRIDLEKVWSVLMRMQNNSNILIIDRITVIFLPFDDCEQNTIAARYVHGYQNCDKFITTKLPNETLLQKFWSLVKMKKIETIIALDNPEFQFWPVKSSVITLPNNIDVLLVNEEVTKEFRKLSILLNNSNANDTTFKLNVSLIILSFQGDKIVQNWFMLYEYYSKACGEEDRVLLACSDGYTHCGLFIILDLALRKLKNDKLLDLVWAAGGVTFLDNQFMRTKETLDIVYEVVKKSAGSYRY